MHSEHQFSHIANKQRPRPSKSSTHPGHADEASAPSPQLIEHATGCTATCTANMCYTCETGSQCQRSQDPHPRRRPDNEKVLRWARSGRPHRHVGSASDDAHNLRKGTRPSCSPRLTSAHSRRAPLHIRAPRWPPWISQLHALHHGHSDARCALRPRAQASVAGSGPRQACVDALGPAREAPYEHGVAAPVGRGGLLLTADDHAEEEYCRVARK